MYYMRFEKEFGRKQMKVVILAGGFGTRISEESHLKPKPMVEIGGKPIIWHIMKYYSHFGFNDFIICLGYKGYVIKEYFADYYLHMSDITFDFRNNNQMTVHQNIAEPWKVTLVDTGLNTQTGGRLKRIEKYIGKENFMLTYGDGVGNVDIDKIIEKHDQNNNIVTMTAIQPGGRFGVIEAEERSGQVTAFREKGPEDSGWINAGFMVMAPEIFGYIRDDSCSLERMTLPALCEERKLGIYRHYGFWQCMDTQRDRNLLEKLWNSKNTPWRIWDAQS